MQMYSKAIAKRIIELCKERRITINKLATLSGITQSTLNNIIKCNSKNPSIRTLQRIASGLGMSVSQLLDFPELSDAMFEDD